MAKTYVNLSDVTAGSVLTATAYNNHILNTENILVPPAVRVTLASSTRANGDSTVSWTSAATYDTEPSGDKMHSTSSNSSRLTIRTAGIYLVNGGGNWGVSATGNLRSVNILRNGSFLSGNGSARNQFDGAQVTTTLVIDCAVGDYFEMQTGQNTGGNLGMTDMFFSATWIGRTSLPS